MAIYTQQVAVGTTAVRLDPTTGGTIPQGASIVRNRGSNPVFLGNSAVTTATGFQLDVGETFVADLRRGDALYGVTASTTETVHVLQAGGVN